MIIIDLLWLLAVISLLLLLLPRGEWHSEGC